MRIREKIWKIILDFGCDINLTGECKDVKIDNATDKALSEIKEELMRVMPPEMVPIIAMGLDDNLDIRFKLQNKYATGFNDCRERMVQAITKLFEEK